MQILRVDAGLDADIQEDGVDAALECMQTLESMEWMQVLEHKQEFTEVDGADGLDAATGVDADVEWMEWRQALEVHHHGLQRRRWAMLGDAPKGMARGA